jgi:ABC-type bacteriocin/lantibiotic exporter with double-glycine peptidase domain
VLLPQGANLSGGERQRLALAQALLGEPRLLLLDEATCALDPDTERRVLDHLDTLPSTLLSIAHRASAIADAKRIFNVVDGSVLELPPPGVAGPRRLGSRPGELASAESRSWRGAHEP